MSALEEPYQRGATDYILAAIEHLLASRLPAPLILMMIMELIEHGPAVFQKLIK
jgi:hypothetical protein